MKSQITVGVIFGGPSEEFAVSRRSAATIVSGLREAGYMPIPIGIGRDGHWYGPIPDSEITTFSENAGYEEIIMLPKPGGNIYRLQDFSVIESLDVVFPIIHGKIGEDGRLQGFLDMCRLPYVGCGVASSAIGMDKVYMRDILKAHCITQASYCMLLRENWLKDEDQEIRQVESKMSYPVFVKPANGGSSIGISKAENREELIHAIKLAIKYDRKIIIEDLIDKREVEIAAIGNGEAIVSLPGEVLAESQFYDFTAKYKNKSINTKVPADLSEDLIKQLQTEAKKIYKILDLSGLARIDFFIEKGSNRILLNEVNTLPGFTSISMFAQMWQASGKALSKLLDELIQLAFDRKRENELTIIETGEI